MRRSTIAEYILFSPKSQGAPSTVRFTASFRSLCSSCEVGGLLLTTEKRKRSVAAVAAREGTVAVSLAALEDMVAHDRQNAHHLKSPNTQQLDHKFCRAQASS
jgi:hypothetical protein